MLEIILSAIIAYVIAHLIKITTALVKTKKFDIKHMIKAGGMPSAHSAAVSALTISVYLDQRFTPLLAVTLLFSLIVIRDTTIRAKDTRHTPLEVTVGIILGIIVAFLI